MDENEKDIELEAKFSIPSYAKWPVSFVRGDGAMLWDAVGNQYLDLYGGHCTALLGHCHPRWVAAITRQVARLGFYSNVASSDIRARYLKRLVDFAPRHLTRAFLCNSGTEANETAVKLAIKATGRTNVAAMDLGFHGRTAGALSLTFLGHYRDQFPSVVREVVRVPFAELEPFSAVVDENLAAVIIEPVQSMAGIRVADDAYYAKLVDLAHQNGTLVIFDEIQTGMGRLGASFAAKLWNAPVDLITLAKGIGNGFPMGAVLATEEVSRSVAVGEQGTTFGGGPLACAAGNAVLDVLNDEDLVRRAAHLEQIARQMLVTGPVTRLRGRGLLLGLETQCPAKEVSRFLFSKNILVGTSADPHVLRLMPPLNVTEKDLQQLALALTQYPKG